MGSDGGRLGAAVWVPFVREKWRGWWRLKICRIFMHTCA
jgi:hypothetical protein